MNTNTDTLTPTPQTALATSIQHFGKQNFVGLLVLGLLALAGLVLWVTFGAWPQRMIRRLRARAASCNIALKSGGTAKEGESEGRRGADLGRDAAAEEAEVGAQGAHVHGPEHESREPSESEEGKVQSRSSADEDGAPGSPQSLEMEVESLEKGTGGGGGAVGEAKGRTLPRVRFA